MSSSLSVLGGTLWLDALVSVDWSRMEPAARGIPDLGSWGALTARSAERIDRRRSRVRVVVDVPRMRMMYVHR